MVLEWEAGILWVCIGVHIIPIDGIGVDVVGDLWVVEVAGGEDGVDDGDDISSVDGWCGCGIVMGSLTHIGDGEVVALGIEVFGVVLGKVQMDHFTHDTIPDRPGDDKDKGDKASVGFGVNCPGGGPVLELLVVKVLFIRM